MTEKLYVLEIHEPEFQNVNFWFCPFHLEPAEYWKPAHCKKWQFYGVYPESHLQTVRDVLYRKWISEAVEQGIDMKSMLKKVSNYQQGVIDEEDFKEAIS